MSTGFTSFNTASNLNCTRIKQKLFSKRSLACIWVRDDGKTAASENFCGGGAGGIGIDGNSALINLVRRQL